MDDATKRDLLYIRKLVLEYDVRNRIVAGKVVELAHKNEVLTSYIGNKFLKRITTLAEGNMSNTSCITCKKETSNGLLCDKCLLKIETLYTPPDTKERVAELERNQAALDKLIRARRRKLAWLWILLGVVVIGMAVAVVDLLKENRGDSFTATPSDTTTEQNQVASDADRRLAETYVIKYCEILSGISSDCNVVYEYEAFGENSQNGYATVNYWIKFNDEKVANYTMFLDDSKPAVVILASANEAFSEPDFWVLFPKTVTAALSDSEALEIYGQCKELWMSDVKRGDGRVTRLHYGDKYYSYTNNDGIYVYSIENK